MTPRTVVFVCTGNTCRSPLAMVLARRRWPTGVTFLSAGLQAVAGLPATEHAATVAGERQTSLADHRSRALTPDLVAGADWIIGMTRSHVAQLNAGLRGRSGVKLGLLGWPNRNLLAVATPDEEEVADPFGASLETYRTVADQIERLLAAWDERFAGPAST